jgi:hypothetical protein
MSLCASCVHRHLPWVREAPFQAVHCVPRFLSLSNNLGNLLFGRQTTPMVIQTGFRCSLDTVGKQVHSPWRTHLLPI